MGLTILLMTFIIGLIFGIPVAVTLGLSSALYLLWNDIPLVVIAQKMYAGIDTFVLLSIPGFILAGNLMNQGGITQRIIRLANSLVGWMRGGLGLSNVAGSMLFGGISGTAAADAASIGGVMIPGMVRSGYPAGFSAAVTAASSTVGPIIPPSVPMIIAGSLSGLSVGKMFLAGAIPGFLLGFSMMVLTYVLARKYKYPYEEWKGFKEVFLAFFSSIWAVMMSGLIVGGMISGIMTPTETAVVASFYAFIVGCFIYRELPVRKVPKIIIESALSSAGILVLVGFANVFGWILVSERIPDMLVRSVSSMTDNPIVIILLINLLLLFVGMFMETIAALIVLFVPLLALAENIGMDPIHFATMAVLNLMIGLTTPPVGVCLFITANIAKISLTQVVKSIFPFLICNIIVMFIVAYFPWITTWLPSLIK